MRHGVRDINEVTEQVIGAAIEVHRALGPGLFESAYQKCMELELRHRRVPFVRQHPVPLTYHGIELDVEYKVDLLVDGRVVVELKTVERVDPVHHAQVLTYLKLSRCQVGLLINFNVAILKHGIKRFANRLPPSQALPGRPSRPPHPDR